MSSRPSITAEAVAAITSAAPRRLVAKLDASPRLAESWDWPDGDGDSRTVASPGGDTVTLTLTDGSVASPNDVRCSCLLSPKCLHVLAVVTLLPVAEPAPAGVEAGEPEQRRTAATALSSDRRAAALLAWRASANVLSSGASSTGAVAQAELLRAIHACRVEGLHRAAAAGLRVVQAIRDLRAERPQFQLSALTEDLFDLLDTSLELAENAAVDDERIGVARRAYSSVGNLRLHGLFTEPVIAPGYAGVVTYLADGDCRIWSLPDVLPGEAARATAAYDAAAGLGDASLAHRALCREGLFVQNATGSRDGRLGGGAGVKGVRASASSWRDVKGLWETPFDRQIDRAYEGGIPAAGALVFGLCEMVGLDADSVVALIDRGDGRPVPVRWVAATDHASLPYRDNLRLLARAPGLAVAFAARVIAGRPRTAALLAIGEPLGEDGEDARSPRLRLPLAWRGRCNLGLDRLSQSYITTLEPEAPRARLDDPPDPLEALRRRLDRFVLGGRATIPPESLRIVEREAALLERRLMPAGAGALRELARAACSAGRATTGERRAPDTEAIGRAFREAARYEREATRVLLRAAWR